MLLLLATQGKAWARALRGSLSGKPGPETHLTHRGATQWRLPAAILEVLASSSLHPPQGEMQEDTSLPPPTGPSASNSALGARLQASVLEVPSKSETGCHACPKAPRKPSISKVILGVMADKGVHSRVSLTFLRNALTTAGYNMTRNKRRFKRVLQGLVDKGLLKQVTGRGTWGSFRMCKKHASKFKVKLKTKRRQQKQHWSGQRWSGQCRPRQRRLTLSPKQGHEWLIKAARRVAKCHRN